MEKRNDNLEKKAIEYNSKFPLLGKYDAFIAGANWQKDQEQVLSITPFEKAIKETIEVSKKINFKDPEGRPDLSFITSQRFETDKDYMAWFGNLTPEQKRTVDTLTNKLPALIAIAEMQFDSMLGTPAEHSIVFQVVSETLNAGK